MGENKLKKAYRNICLTEWVDKKLQQIELSNKERDEKLSEINIRRLRILMSYLKGI